MSTLKTFIDGKGITTQAIAITSRRLEAFGENDWTLRDQRAAKRRNEPEKKYAEANLAKPKSGRGVSLKVVEQAVAGKPVTRKSRAKILAAVNALLSKKKQGAADMKVLFEGAAARVGKKEEKKGPGEGKK